MGNQFLTIVVVAAAMLPGCTGEQPNQTPDLPDPPAVVGKGSDLPSGIRALGDEIAGLPLADARGLSNYLSNAHGIAPVEQELAPRGNETEEPIPPRIKELGDRIAALSVEEASALSRYLEDRHGLKPAGETLRVKEVNPQEKPMRVFHDANDAIEAIRNYDGRAEGFLLPIADSMNDPAGANMATITDSILARGWSPNGFEQREGYRIYMYKED